MTSQRTIGFFFLSRKTLLYHSRTCMIVEKAYVYLKERKGGRNYDINIYHYHTNNEI